MNLKASQQQQTGGQLQYKKIKGHQLQILQKIRQKTSIWDFIHTDTYIYILFKYI